MTQYLYCANLDIILAEVLKQLEGSLSEERLRDVSDIFFRKPSTSTKRIRCCLLDQEDMHKGYLDILDGDFSAAIEFIPAKGSYKNERGYSNAIESQKFLEHTRKKLGELLSGSLPEPGGANELRIWLNKLKEPPSIERLGSVLNFENELEEGVDSESFRK